MLRKKSCKTPEMQEKRTFINFFIIFTISSRSCLHSIDHAHSYLLIILFTHLFGCMHFFSVSSFPWVSSLIIYVITLRSLPILIVNLSRTGETKIVVYIRSYVHTHMPCIHIYILALALELVLSWHYLSSLRLPAKACLRKHFSWWNCIFNSAIANCF